MQNLDTIVEKIINSPLFLKLKGVVENSPWHDNESVYDHLLKTYEIAKREINGEFITNLEAKKLFLEFVNAPFGNLKTGDVMLIIALVHDIGKILYYKDENQEKPLRQENQNGTTRMPGHEYWGSTIIDKILKGVGLDNNIVEKIAKVVKLHDTFNEGYFGGVADWPIDVVVDDVKARAEGLYKETLFNIYCDVFTAKPSQNSITKIIEIFNQPSLYSPREYFIK